MRFNFLTRSIVVFLAATAAWSVAAAARGDLIELSSGGRITGTIIERPSGPTGAYVIETASGGRMRIARSDIARIQTIGDAEQQYIERARSSPDTVEAHWELAEWCREQKLRDRSQQHLARIIELDPQHSEARSLLGFRNKDGQWMTRDEVMASRGMVMHGGRYLSPQHIELLERQNETRMTQADWKGRLNLLRRWLTGRRPERADQALAEVQAVRDPLAAKAVVDLLAREEDPVLRRLWIDTAGRLDSRLTVDALVNLSLVDPDEEIRIHSLELLIRSGRKGLVGPYIRALKNRDNEIVSRAAAALNQIGEREAIRPLIEALETQHTFQVADGNANQQSHTFTADGGSAMSFGGGGPKFETDVIRNPAVLAALVRLSGGVSFDFDKPRWRAWLAAQANAQPIDLRRDL